MKKSQIHPLELKQEKLIAQMNLNGGQLIVLHKVLEIERELTLQEEDPN